MARTRLIKPGFFSNDLLAECDPLARLLFAGLWTIVDRDGRMVDRRARIKAQLLPYDNCNIDHLMGQLVARGFIEVYAVDGVPYLQVTSFAKHQRPHKKELSENLPKPPAPNALVISPGFSATSPGLSATSHEYFGSCPPLTLNPSPFSLDPSPLTVNPSLPSVVSSAPRKARAKPRDGIGWSIEGKWSGITDQDRADWAVAYPYVNIDQDLEKAHQHLLSNPAKQHKKQWRRFLVNWFNRTQEGGGSRTAGSTTERRGPPTGHIPPDAHPDEHYKWYMTNGWTPRLIPIYRTADGRERWLNGDYIDEETSQEHTDENDE